MVGAGGHQKEHGKRKASGEKEIAMKEFRFFMFMSYFGRWVWPYCFDDFKPNAYKDSEEAVNAYHEKLALEKATRTAASAKKGRSL